MKSKNEAAVSKEIIVLGATIKKSIMPEIFRLATANKAALEKTVKSVMAAQGYTNPRQRDGDVGERHGWIDC
ncbi:MAG: hypothetical protein WCK75_07475 [Elusimicrobiota bacterium]